MLASWALHCVVGRGCTMWVDDRLLLNQLFLRKRKQEEEETRKGNRKRTPKEEEGEE